MILDSKQLLARFLKAHLEKAQKKNPQFSMRSFASRLGVSSAALSEIMHAKRSVSQKKALEIATNVPFSKHEANEINKSFEKNDALKKLKPRFNSREEIIITDAHFDLMSDWRYFAFMALTRTVDFQSDFEWIGRRLGLPTSEASAIFEKLQTNGFVQRDQSGEIRDRHIVFRTPEHFPELLLRQRQINGLEAATAAIREQSSFQIGFFSTITTDTSKLKDAEIIIEDFLKKLSLFLSDSGNKQEVCELQIQLFPRTKR